MSLKRNILANYIGQSYVAVIGIVMVPVYLRLMGAEGYGLVAFFAMLQAWFQMLDLGLTATVARETARYLGGGIDARELRRLLRSLEGLFWAIGIAGASLLAAAAPSIGNHWLHYQTLPPATVETSLMLIAAAIGLRWICGLYRAAISGLERQVWLNAFNVAIATARFVGVIPLLVFAGTAPTLFFLFQCVVSVIELGVLVVHTYRWIPVPPGTRISWSLQPLRQVMGFSMTVAFATVVWVLVTQTDKLIISKLLPLKEYGFFTAAVLMASSITLMSGPIAQALLPRLTRLAQGPDDLRMLLLYRQATQAVAAFSASATLVLVFFANDVLWLWTGNAQLAWDYAVVLALYAIGNGFLALAAFPYYLQFAKGNLQLHLWGNVAFIVILLPAVVIATSRFGAIGAGSVWAATNALFFLVWTPLVHNRFAPGLHRVWLAQDILRVIAPPSVAAAVLSLVPMQATGVLGRIGLIVATGSFMIVLSLCACGLLRPYLRSLFSRSSQALR